MMTARDLTQLAPEYAHVFAGTVTRSENGRAQFEIGEVLKGAPAPKTWYRADFPLGDCSSRLVEGETSIFFLREEGGELRVTRFLGVTRAAAVEALGARPRR